MNEPQLELSAAELQSPLWQKIETYCKRRLSFLRRGNDNYTWDASKTQLTRGRIAEVKKMLALPNKGRTAQDDDYSDSPE
jgi:hypothetical protein